MADPQVAIVDYGMGNLFSVRAACQHVGLNAEITADPTVVRAAAAVILPGVGAMPDAIDVLERSGLAAALHDVIARDVPFFGICLGMQLLMTEGTEFRPHRGLGVVPGTVRRIDGRTDEGAPLKVPHIGWNAIVPTRPDAWADTPLAPLEPGALVYFVHSYCAVPADDRVVAAVTTYGTVTFCAALQVGNVFACQFHPERSGPAGLAILHAFADRVHSLADRA